MVDEIDRLNETPLEREQNAARHLDKVVYTADAHDVPVDILEVLAEFSEEARRKQAEAHALAIRLGVGVRARLVRQDVVEDNRILLHARFEVTDEVAEGKVEWVDAPS